MSTQTHDSTAQSIEKKTVAGVSFDGTAGGKLDESEISSDSFKSHYMYPADTKSDSTYPVVDASGDLRKGNVTSAWELGCRGRCSDSDKHDSRLKKLSAEFDSDPLADKTRKDKRLERTVQFEKADADEQIAYGAVLVPDRVDHMGDFFRAETVAGLAENFEKRVEDRDAVPGVMHSVFPGHVSLAENRLTDEAVELGERDLPAGSWVQGWKFEDDELWQLVNDGVLGGYSIGGTISDDWVLYNEDAHPDDVEFPDEVADEIEAAGLDTDEVTIREITDGRILEVSAVDMPAVPDATHEEYKSLEKGHPALTGGLIDARLYLESRGHDPEDAKRLAEYLQSEKSKEPDGWIGRAKRFFTDTTPTSERKTRDMDGERAEKGQVLSEENLTRGMAIHDVALDLLGTEIDHGRRKFAEDSAYDFAGVAFVQPEDSSGSGTILNAQQSADPGGSGTGRDADADPTDDPLENMSDEETNEVLERLEELESKFEDDDGAQTDEKDADADTSDESSESVERLEELESKFEQQAEAQARTLELLEQMASAQGVSQQADTSTGNGTEKGTWNDSPFAKRAGGD